MKGDREKVRVKLTVGEIARLDLKPGDVLCVRLPNLLTADQHAAFQSAMAKLFAGNKVLLLTGGAELSIVPPSPDAVVSTPPAPETPHAH